ncbi:metalloprotease [Halorhabdus sp. CBA1104]|uniref:metalloprotease n=1 Tax=unclassified Halorhabdus TaxID=2621901 RepID=UPI0012B2B8B3|nr:metalloprotease [Halorhabdus sp. CBA1104]
MQLRFSRRELVDLFAAWVALSVAFTVFLNPYLLGGATVGLVDDVVETFLRQFVTSLGTVGVAFICHELAHKIVAVRFGQLATFRADYGLLLLAIVSALAGFLFAAPGAVVHRGRITPRESGLISLAGPASNLVLAAVFFATTLVASPAVADAAALGVTVNLLLAGFNMLPVGPLDGRTVVRWNRAVYVAVAVPSIALAVTALFGIGF